MKCTKTYTTLLMFLMCLLSFSQGIFNNGANIVLSGAAQIYIDGGTNGGYLSQNGGIINPSATGVISMEGNWTNNAANTGFFTDNGTVILNGANQSITGSASTTFYNLTLQGSGTKTQNLNTSVGGVSTTNGVLSVGNVIYDLNASLLTITNPLPAAVTVGSGYVLSETNAAVNPSIMRWNMGTSTGVHVFPFGVAATQIPFTFNKTTAGASNIDVSTRATAASNNLPWAGASNVGGVSFFFCPNNAMAGNACAANSVIDRWWDITPSAAVTANVTFSYRGIENSLTPPYNTGNIGAQWWDGSFWNNDNATIGSALAVTAGVGNVTATGLNQFCPFVLSSVSVPLPVALVNLNIQCLDKGNLITWNTLSETNSAYFSIERSNDAVHFIEITRISAHGNSASKLSYSYVDEQISDAKTVYYRLTEVSNTQVAKKYKIISTDNCAAQKNNINITNTINGDVFIAFNSMQETTYTAKVFDLLGKLIKEETITTNKGLYKTQLKVEGVPKAIYVLQISGNEVFKSQKIALNTQL